MKNHLEEHRIGFGGGGNTSILNFLAQAKYRNMSYFGTEKQLEVMSAIARIEDKDARNLLLSVMGWANEGHKQNLAMHEEFEMLHKVLVKVNGYFNEDIQKATESA